MDLAGIALVITAITGLLTALGTGVWAVVTMILKAYKEQAASTVAAKDGEIQAKDARITRQEVTIEYQREENADLRKKVLA